MPEPANRTDPPFAGDERATLEGFLDHQRATLAWKCEGLGDDQLRRRAIEPSNLSLLGLVRHIAEVERGWFRHGVAGEDRVYRWITDADPDAEFDRVEEADVGEAFVAWREECDRSRAIGSSRSLDDTFETRHGPIALRWLYCHMIEEYARHNGHADLLRERLDGATGE